MQALGQAWLVPRTEDLGDVDGPAWARKWERRPGRPKNGALDDRAAHVRAAELVLELEREIVGTDEVVNTGVFTFDDAVAEWMRYLRTERAAKASTMENYRSMLRSPDEGEANPRGARLMRSFGGRDLRGVTHDDVRRFLERLDDEEDVGPRTVNVHRQALAGIFGLSVRRRHLRLSPVDGIAKRREARPAEIVTFSPEQVHAIARVMAAGRHRRPLTTTGEHVTDEAVADRARQDQADAALLLFLGFTGARIGEALALRWRHVRWDADRIVIARSYSAGVESSPKSGRERSVPMAVQVATALDGLSKRRHFTGPDDLVFTLTGEHLDRTAVRRRYVRARDIARNSDPAMPELRLHDLRHTFGSLAAGRFDLVAVQAMLGHSDIRTTSRYLHSRPAAEDAARLSQVFEAAPVPVAAPRPFTAEAFEAFRQRARTRG
ncbi:MAG: tyrosine-type recombinase/integrase [Solirubrobacteraceae bacterium]|nr:tyrosine-type recombinase/integrase [Solirubrobacteraceae bacterium]